jgi:hypothetical protein
MININNNIYIINGSIVVDLLELYYIRIGSTWINDSFYMFLILPLALFSFVTSFVTFCVFMKRDFNKMLLYKYLRVFTLNNTMLSLIGSLCFITYCQRYVPFGSTLIPRIYRCKITNYVLNTLYFYGNILDVVIVFERLSKFDKRVESFVNYSPNKLSFILFLTCLTINFPMYFVYTVKSDEEYYSNLFSYYNLLTFTYCGREPFFASFYGKLVILGTIFLRDIVTLVLEFVVSLIAIVEFRKYLNARARMFSCLPYVSTTQSNKTGTVLTNSIDSTSHNNNSEKPQNRKVKQLKTKSSIMINQKSSYRNKMKLAERTQPSSETQTQTQTSPITFQQKRVQNNLMNLNKRLTKMTFIIAIQSFLAHIATFIDTLMFLIFDNTLIAHHLTLLNFFLVSCKQIGNFVCFYYLNTDLRKQIQEQLTRMKKDKVKQK